MTRHMLFRGKLPLLRSILLFCLAMLCVASDQRTVPVVAQVGAKPFPIGTDNRQTMCSNHGHDRSSLKEECVYAMQEPSRCSGP